MNEDRATTDVERDVLALLSGAWGRWLCLPDRRWDDDLEFQQAIHQAQCLIALRVARRADPETFPSVPPRPEPGLETVFTGVALRRVEEKPSGAP